MIKKYSKNIPDLLHSQVKVQNDFSDEMFTSEWHYAKDIVNRETVTGTTTGYRNYDFHKKHDTTQVQLYFHSVPFFNKFHKDTF